MRDLNSPGYSTMSDLLWYFACPWTAVFDTLTYADFFRLYYLETLDVDDPLQHDQIPIGPVNTERGLRQKVIRRRVRGPIVTRLQVVPIRRKELFYLRAILQTRPAFSFEGLRTVAGICHPSLLQHLVSFETSAKPYTPCKILSRHIIAPRNFAFSLPISFQISLSPLWNCGRDSKSIYPPISACTTIQHEPLIWPFKTFKVT